MKTKMPYSAPDGYLENLRNELSAIPGRAAGSGDFHGYVRMGFALAMSVAVVLAAGVLFPRRTVTPAVLPDEEIVDYLIDSGISEEELYL